MKILTPMPVLSCNHQGFGRAHQTQDKHDRERQPECQMKPDRRAEANFGIQRKADDDRADQKDDERYRAIPAVLAGKIDVAIIAPVADFKETLKKSPLAASRASTKQPRQ